MCSINHSHADGHGVEFCKTPKAGVTHNECLTAINKGVRLFQNCSKEYGCDRFTEGYSQKGNNVKGTIRWFDNSIRFLYDGKWFFIRNDYNYDKKRWTTQCYAFYMTPCTD